MRKVGPRHDGVGFELRLKGAGRAWIMSRALCFGRMSAMNIELASDRRKSCSSCSFSWWVRVCFRDCPRERIRGIGGCGEMG